MIFKTSLTSLHLIDTHFLTNSVITKLGMDFHWLQISKSIKSRHWMSSVKKYVLKNLANFTGKYLCWNIFLIKLQDTYFEEHLRTTASKSMKISLASSPFWRRFMAFIFNPNKAGFFENSFSWGRGKGISLTPLHPPPPFPLIPPPPSFLHISRRTYLISI